MSFRDSIAKDIKNVFIRTDEFADIRTIVYDGETYSIACVVHTFDEDDRKPGASDHMEGLHKTSTYLHCAYEDLPVMPERGTLFLLSDITDAAYLRQYRVDAASYEEGILHVTLEAIDE